MSIVEKNSCRTTFRVVNPDAYPYGGNSFEDEEEIKLEHWSDFVAGETALDVGAAWGGYSLPALAQGASVIAFDATDDSARILTANVQANDVSWMDRFQFYKAALWDGETDYPEWMRREIFEVRYPVGTTAPIPSLDQVLRALGGVKVTRIKVDVEGAELGVLRGARETLRKWRPRLLVEDHSGIYERCNREESTLPILSLLAEAGYADVREQWYGDRPGGRSFVVAR